MAYLKRDGVEVYYEVHGSGPALLLSHGFSATSKMWLGQIEALSKEHTLILWDMRGHGQSGSPEDDRQYSEGLTVKDMAALLDQLGFERGIIGGLSLGGYMSMAFHAEFPERVTALLIIDTGPGYKKDAAREQWNVDARAMADAIDKHGAAALRNATAEQRTSVHSDYSGLARAGRFMLTQHSSRVMESLPDIAVPALVLAGADDVPFLVATNYMANKIPNARKVIIPEAGHAVNLDQPEAFNNAVTRFLRENNL